MEFDAVIEKRRSARSFIQNKRPTHRQLLAAVDAARKCPFAGNWNNFKFIIVENPDSIKKLAQYADQLWIAEAPTVVIVYANENHLESMYGERGRIYSRQQAGAFIHTFMLKLTDIGLSSCWVGAYNDEMIRSTFGIPGHFLIEAIIPVGYEKYEKGKTLQAPKKQIASIIDWEVWDKSRRPQLLIEKKDPNSLI